MNPVPVLSGITITGYDGPEGSSLPTRDSGPRAVTPGHEVRTI